MTFDESVMYKDREQKVLEITKQVGVEVELEKRNPRDVEADTQPTPTKESEVGQVTPEQVLRRSSRIMRAPDRYSPSLHYLLLIYEGDQSLLMRPYRWRTRSSGIKPWMMR